MAALRESPIKRLDLYCYEYADVYEEPDGTTVMTLYPPPLVTPPRDDWESPSKRMRPLPLDDDVRPEHKVHDLFAHWQELEKEKLSRLSCLFGDD